MLQLEDVLRPERVVHLAGGRDPSLVQRGQDRHRPVAGQRVPACRKQLVRRDLQRGLHGGRIEQHPAEARTAAELFQHERQAAVAVAPAIARQGVRGAGDGPVGVELAEDEVLVPPSQTRRPPRHLGRPATGRAGPGVEFRPQDQVPDVGHDPDRR